MAEPIAAYNFDEADGPVLDVTGNGHGFSLATGMSRVAGHTGSALESTNGTVDGPPVFGQTPQRTLMFWLKSTASFTGWIYEWTTGSTGLWGMLVGVPSGQMGFRAKSDGGATQFAGIARPSDNAWHHWAGTFDGSVVRCYVDGALRATSSALSGGIGTSATAIRWHDTVSGSQPVDDLRVYDVALSQSEIAALMAAPVTLPAPPAPAATGRLKYESSPGVWTPVPIKTAAGDLLAVKTETSPGTWEPLS
jgi:hypothetical protein